MGFSTKTYNLPYFQLGDPYSARLDTKRMRVVDNLLEFIARSINTGVGEGWNVEFLSTLIAGPTGYSRYFINPGNGIIEQYAERTNGKLYFDLPNSGTFDVYLQKVVGTCPIFGAFYLSAGLANTDATIPGVPSGLAGIAVFNEVTLSWNENSEVDFGHYILQKSTDNITFTDIICYTNFYTDEAVEENTIYYYKLKAVDFSDNESAASSVFTIATPLDITVPSNPKNVSLISGNNMIHLYWESPEYQASSSIEYSSDISYRIELYDGDILDTLVSSTDTFRTFLTLNSLENKQYKVIVYSISRNGILSSGVEIYATPTVDISPNEVVLDSIVAGMNPASIETQAIDITCTYASDIVYTGKPVATRVAITLIENGKIQSDDIFWEIPEDGEISRVISSFTVNGVAKKIANRTKYLVKIRTVDANFNFSAGVAAYVKTECSSSPAAPSNLRTTQIDSTSIQFSWINSKNSFVENIIRVTKGGTEIFSGSVGKQSSYIIDENELSSSDEYVLELYCQDEFFNTSEQVSIAITPEISFKQEDEFVHGMLYQYGPKCLYLSWTKPVDTRIQKMRLYRSSGNLQDPTLYVQIAEIDINKNLTNYSFVDYDVVGGASYNYLISSVDFSGNDSFSQVFSAIIQHQPVKITVKDNDEFSEIEDFVVTKAGFNASLSWTASSGVFDGYQIYRSVGNKYSWELTGSIHKNATTFTDTNALIETETYYYMIRKYREACKPFLILSTSRNIPQNAILLGTVVNTAISDKREIIDPNVPYFVDQYVQEKLLEHDHSLNKIDLKESMEFTSWTSYDGITFTTTEDFSGATEYKLFINNALYSNVFELDFAQKKIILPSAASAFTIKLIAIGMNELEGLLPEFKAKSLSPSMVEGALVKTQVPKLSHGGVKEELLPLSSILKSEDGYKFEIASNTETNKSLFSAGLTIYSILDIGSALLLGTSKGIAISYDSGITISLVNATTVPISKVYKAPISSIYYAIGGNQVFSSSNGISWTIIDGTKDINIIRDILEISSGVVIISTSNGLYEIDGTQLAKLAVNTSNFYGMAQVGTKALVSSEDGIYSSTNAGLTWSIETTNSLITPIYEFLQISGYIFGLCNKSIVVSDDSYISFSQVYYAEKDLFSLQVYNSELYVIEGRDVLKSSSYIFFTPIEFAKIGISNVIPKTLLAVDDSLYVGGEEIFAEYNFLSNSVVHKYFTTENCTKFFIAENSTFTKDFSRKEKFARVYYSSSGNYCYTLDYTNDDKIFSAAIQFDYFGRKDGGWIQNTFDATAEIYQNGKFIENIVGPANITTTALIASLNEGLTTASAISADNSNYTIASDYISEFGASIAKIQTSTESSVELYQNVEDSVRLYDKMYSKMNYPVKYFESLIINGTNFTGVNGHIIFETSAPTYFSDYALVPSLSLKNTGTNHIADIGTGSIFLQGTSSDQFEIAVHNGNIIDLGVNTHKQIDDAIELSSSGLTFNMMESFADALGKTGLAIHNNFDTFENKPIQGENILFTKQHQYDVLNSTIKYSLLTSNFAAENKLIFPNDVYASEDFAYIATTGGIQVVDLTTFVSSFEEFEEDIYGIRVLSGTIYCFSRTSVYDFATKEKVELYGLTGTIYDVAFFGTSLLIATSTGTFLKYSSETVCNLVQDVANSVGSKLFVNKFSFLYSGGNFYSSSNGINWTLLGAISQQRFFEFVSFKNVSWIATSRGLRSDFSNFYSGGVATSLIDLMSDPYLSEALIMNCVASDGTYLCAGDSSGVLYLVDELGIFSNSNLGIGAIYKVIFSGTNILAFGANCIKVVPISSIATGTVVIFENGVPL